MQSDQGEESAVKNLNGGTALSGDEFRRLQEQLIELRNLNYELIEKNKQLQNQTPKSSETFRFATKFIGRKADRQDPTGKWEEEINSLRAKLITQEEEFRLQQSTLLAELNKVIAQNKVLEEKLKLSGKVTFTEEDKKDETASKSEHELEKEVACLKGVLAEKDSLVKDLEILHKDLLRAKDAESERADGAEKRCAVLGKHLDEQQRFYRELEETLKIETEENTLLKSRYEELCRKKDAKLRNVDCQYDAYHRVDASTSCDQVSEGKIPTNSEVFVQTDSDYMKECTSLQKTIADLQSRYEKVLEAKNKCEIHINDLTASNEKRLKEIAFLKSHNEELQGEVSQCEGTIAQLKEKELLSIKERDEWLLKEKVYTENTEALESSLKESSSKWEQEVTTLRNEFKEMESKLELQCKQEKEKLKAKDQEMHVALKKQSSMVKELRRQVQQEKKRADQAERQLEEALGSGRHYRMSGSPLVSSDHSRTDGRNGVEGSSSVCSWAFVAENDRRSTHTFDGDESSCSASVLESDNVELISRLAQLQKKHSETIDKLNMLEEENTMLRKEVTEKSEVIAEWIRTKPSGEPCPASSPSIRIRRMFDIVRIDDSAADIRDMNRKLQRMLEETLSKNLHLQKDIQKLLENGKTDVLK